MSFLSRSSLLSGMPLMRRGKASMYTDMTKNLKIKGLAIDLNIIIGTADDIPVDSTPSVGEKIAATLPTLPERSVEEKKLLEILGPQAKYADKIKLRLAKNVASRANPLNDNMKAAMVGTASRWLIVKGMGEVLDYTHNRSVKILAVGSPQDFPDHTIAQLKSQLNLTKLSYVRPFLPKQEDTDGNSLPTSPEVLKNHNLAVLLEMEEKMNLSKNQLMLVSSDEALLTLAKDRGYYTCRYRGPGRMFGQVATDYLAKSPIEIKDAIDDLIGVSLRGSVNC